MQKAIVTAKVSAFVAEDLDAVQDGKKKLEVVVGLRKNPNSTTRHIKGRLNRQPTVLGSRGFNFKSW